MEEEREGSVRTVQEGGLHGNTCILSDVCVVTHVNAQSVVWSLVSHLWSAAPSLRTYILYVEDKD